ncbi:MAG: hypothetical protein HYY00_09330 [Chloroflexi bacterium]|nr:hypothetical protein [Chloroflexota bacterium]
MEPFEISVVEASARIRRGDLSPVALVESLIARIESLEPTLRAWVTLDRDGATQQAQDRQRELERGTYRGPLHGIPVGVKDIFHTAGLRTTACSRLYADFVPTRDATCVARLREAGAIILGKTVTTEFATADPPPTRNPWNAAHTPGGSSSGSAASVAARACPAALGSQTAGSVLRPAAYNGIVGLKPTYGRLSRWGVFAVSWSLDTMGVLARTVEDSSLLLQAMAGADPKDPASSTRPVPDYLAEMNGMDRPPRVGLVREFFYGRATDEVRRHTDATAQRLAEAGAVVEEIRLPRSFYSVHPAHWAMARAECASVHEGLFLQRREEYSPMIRRWIEEGFTIPATRYLQAQRLRRRFQEEMATVLERADVLLTPATTSEAPRDLTTTGNPIFQTPWTFAGLPAIAIPSGLSRSGLPLGVQLAAAPFAEGKLLAAARWCERELGVRLAPPGLGLS